MAVPIVLSPETCYVTKINIAYPGNQTAATAAESTAQTRINDALTEATISVSGGAIEVAS